MRENIYQSFREAGLHNRKKLAVLIDPDKITPESLVITIDNSVKASADYFFIGGSLLINDIIGECIDVIKSFSEIPVIIFPGSAMQVYPKADAILLLSLISGRNADLLIGQQVIAAPALKNSGLEVISTGYILIDGGIFTTVSYVSNTLPVPYQKDEIAMSTAMAGNLLGLKCIYLDTGSGALQSVSGSMVTLVKENIDVPLIVGGGIKSPEQASAICKAGADIIVVGTAVENDPSAVLTISNAVHSSIFF